jgi:nephrocystin-1
MNIPSPNKEELTILSRKVRVCLFDGEKIHSNIHTIQAHVVGKEEKNWVFEDELSENVSIMDFSEFFVRIDLPNDKSEIPPNLGILFELTYYCKSNVSLLF